MYIQIFVLFSVAKKVWKQIVTKYFLRTARKTIRKIDLSGLFNELYQLALTPKQVVAGFSRAGVWPFDSGANKDKVVKQPLTIKQLNQLPQTTRYYNIFDLQTKYFLIIEFFFI